MLPEQSRSQASRHQLRLGRGAHKPWQGRGEGEPRARLSPSAHPPGLSQSRAGDLSKWAALRTLPRELSAETVAVGGLGTAGPASSHGPVPTARVSSL